MRPLREKLASDEEWQTAYRKIEICPSRIVEHILITMTLFISVIISRD